MKGIGICVMIYKTAKRGKARILTYGGPDAPMAIVRFQPDEIPVKSIETLYSNSCLRLSVFNRPHSSSEIMTYIGIGAMVRKTSYLNMTDQGAM